MHRQTYKSDLHYNNKARYKDQVLKKTDIAPVDIGVEKVINGGPVYTRIKKQI